MWDEKFLFVLAALYTGALQIIFQLRRHHLLRIRVFAHGWRSFIPIVLTTIMTYFTVSAMFVYSNRHINTGGDQNVGFVYWFDVNNVLAIMAGIAFGKFVVPFSYNLFSPRFGRKETIAGSISLAILAVVLSPVLYQEQLSSLLRRVGLSSLKTPVGDFTFATEVGTRARSTAQSPSGGQGGLTGGFSVPRTSNPVPGIQALLADLGNDTQDIPDGQDTMQIDKRYIETLDKNFYDQDESRRRLKRGLLERQMSRVKEYLNPVHTLASCLNIYVGILPDAQLLFIDTRGVTSALFLQHKKIVSHLSGSVHGIPTSKDFANLAGEREDLTRRVEGALRSVRTTLGARAKLRVEPARLADFLHLVLAEAEMSGIRRLPEADWSQNTKIFHTKIDADLEDFRWVTSSDVDFDEDDVRSVVKAFLKHVGFVLDLSFRDPELSKVSLSVIEKWSDKYYDTYAGYGPEVHKALNLCNPDINRSASEYGVLLPDYYYQPYTSLVLSDLLYARGVTDEAISVLAEWMDAYENAAKNLGANRPPPDGGSPAFLLSPWYKIRVANRILLYLEQVTGQESRVYKDLLKLYTKMFSEIVAWRKLDFQDIIQQCEKLSDVMEQRVLLVSLLNEKEAVLSEVAFLSEVQSFVALEQIWKRAQRLAKVERDCIPPLPGTEYVRPDYRTAHAADLKVTAGLVGLALADRMDAIAVSQGDRNSVSEARSESERWLRDGWGKLEGVVLSERREIELRPLAQRLFVASEWERSATRASRALSLLRGSN